MIPSPAELHYFLEVAGTLNISRAAERLGISQPTLSVAIQRLEANLGTPVLIRGKSGVRLTQAGQRLVAQGRLLVDEWEKFRAGTFKAENNISGRYVIGCHPSVALYSLSSFLPDLLRSHPELEIKLVHDLSRRVTEDVISFKTDFGIVVNPIEHPDLVIKVLCRDEVTLWVGRGDHAVQDPASGKAVLICDPDLLQSQAMMKGLVKRNMKFARTVTSSNLEVITSLVAAGAGIGILPSRVATRVKSFGLRPLEGDGHRLADRICLIYRADAQRSKASRAIAGLIERNMKPD